VIFVNRAEVHFRFLQYPFVQSSCFKISPQDPVDARIPICNQSDCVFPAYPTQPHPYGHRNHKRRLSTKIASEQNPSPVVAHLRIHIIHTWIGADLRHLLIGFHSLLIINQRASYDLLILDWRIAAPMWAHWTQALGTLGQLGTTRRQYAYSAGKVFNRYLYLFLLVLAVGA
jgi:hypothetical protein